LIAIIYGIINQENGFGTKRLYKRIIEIHPGQKAIIASGFTESEQVKKKPGVGRWNVC